MGTRTGGLVVVFSTYLNVAMEGATRPVCGGLGRINELLPMMSLLFHGLVGF